MPISKRIQKAISRRFVAGTLCYLPCESKTETLYGGRSDHPQAAGQASYLPCESETGTLCGGRSDHPQAAGQARYLPCWFVLVSIFLLAGCSGEKPAEPEPDPNAASEPATPAAIEIVKGKVYETTCVACHGDSGQGNRELGAPSIASLPAWYVTEQLAAFQKGWRGTHPEDIHGQQMRAIAMLLDSEMIDEVAEVVAKMPRILTVSTDPDPPSITSSKKWFADSCMACHRYNGTGERVFHSAPLIGLQDWYHAEQMRKYRDGLRGTHKDDFYGHKMVSVASHFDDEKIRAMAAYLAALAQGDDPREVMNR